MKSPPSRHPAMASAADMPGLPALRALEASESRYRRLFETARDGILLLNADTAQIEDVNPYLIELLGYSHAEFLGKKLWEVGPFADVAQSKEMFAELQTKGYVQYEDLPLRTRAGARVQVEFVSNSYDCEGIKVIQCNIRNITERKRAEDSTRDSEVHLRAIFDGALDGIVVADAHSRKLLTANAAICNALGYTQEEMVRLDVSDIHPKDDLPRVINKFERVLHDENQMTADIPMMRKDGSVYYADIKATRIRFGGKDAILGVFRDITKRKDSQARLQKLSQAVEQSPAATVITDIHGRFEYVNPKFLEVTGYTQEELIGKTPAVIKSGFTPLDVYEDLWRTILSAREWRGEMQNRRKNGELYWEDEIISCVKNERGEIVNFIAVKEDVTERKRAEEALQLKRALLLETERELVNAREALADADRLESVGRLAAGVAHEVKNPLMIIRLGVDYLSKQFSQESNQGVLDDIRGAIERADKVIMDLLDFSKQKQFVRHQTDINNVIDKAIHLIKHEIKRRNIVIVRSRNDPMPQIYADPDRLVQVFVNLLSNAAQAIGQNGSIEVVTRSKHLSESDLEQSESSMFRLGEEVIAIDIRDNGPGFSVEQKKKLFEPFFTTKPVGEGSGLGLAVSRNIVSMHKGSINISNHSEGGALALLMFRVAREHLTNE